MSCSDLLREMTGFAAERLMELEVGAVTDAAYGEKDPARRAQHMDRIPNLITRSDGMTGPPSVHRGR